MPNAASHSHVYELLHTDASWTPFLARARFSSVGRVHFLDQHIRSVADFQMRFIVLVNTRCSK